MGGGVGIGHTRAPGLSLQAIADYSRVLELDPDSFNAAYARAGMALLLLCAATTHSRHSYAPRPTAACYNRKGQFAEAIEDYNLALSKDQVSRRCGGQAEGEGRVRGGQGRSDS